MKNFSTNIPSPTFHRKQLFLRLNDGWNSSQDKEKFILDLYEYQYLYNEVYQSYCDNLGKTPTTVTDISKIPFLPISAFKKHKVISGLLTAEKIFTSSGTTGQSPSKHYVADLPFYLNHTQKIWENHFGPLENYCFLALLPGYLEREDSSLIAMMQHFIHTSQHAESGFYLYDHKKLYDTLHHCQQQKIPTILWGVTYSLLDFCENYNLDFPELTVVETGGMKGQKEEITKDEFHNIIKKKWNIFQICSEYGMTELMSQAYATNEVQFQNNPYLMVSTYQINDPLSPEKINKPGIICLTDLANIDSCAFIQTEDLGILRPEGKFEVLGRLEATEWRGCNLLVAE